MTETTVTQPMRTMPSAYNTEQIALIKRTIANGCSDDELSLFIGMAKRTQLDPFARQIYAIKRREWDRDSNSFMEKMTVQTSIDGYRLIAERSGRYAGQQGPWWCGADGVWKEVWLDEAPPVAAKVEVLRHDFKTPLVGTARWADYAAKKKDGSLMGLWAKMGTVMLAKCAEALALRKAFPNDLGGIYTAEEMYQADADTPPAKVASVTGEVKKKLPEWTDDQKSEVSAIFSEIIRLGKEQGEKDIGALRSTMKYDAPSDVIDAAAVLQRRWEDIAAQAAAEGIK